jgi:copper chaperone
MEMKKIKLHVEGMSCGHCENAVQNAISALPGIKKAKASKRKKEAVVEYDSSAVTEELIAEAVRDAGYTVVD